MCVEVHLVYFGIYHLPFPLTFALPTFTADDSGGVHALCGNSRAQPYVVSVDRRRCVVSPSASFYCFLVFTLHRDGKQSPRHAELDRRNERNCNHELAQLFPSVFGESSSCSTHTINKKKSYGIQARTIRQFIKIHESFTFKV